MNRVLVERDGRAATVTLNRPAEGNRLDGELLDEVADLLRDLSGEADVVVLRASGADFSLGREPAARSGVPAPAEVVAEFDRVQAVNDLVQGYPGITVAVVHGRALGAGASLAGRCDLVVAGADARLAFPEVSMGIAPTVVASYFTSRIPRTALLDLVLTGREVDAPEAQRMGLVSRVAPSADLHTQVRELVAHLCALDAEVVRTVKGFIGRADRMHGEEAVRYGIALLANQTVDRAFAETREES